MQKIDHLIDGKAVPGTDYFETVNPATQGVLAEVAAGGADEVNAAVAAAKAAFPAWAGLPATERAKKMRALGELIAKHVPEIAKTETDDTGQTISQTGKQLVPRAADEVGIRDHRRFADVVRAAFGQRRKTLRNALSGTCSVEQIEAAGLRPHLRAEQVPVSDFIRLANQPDAS